MQVLNDTRQVQKEINQLSGKLDRVFVVTEEQIYKVFCCIYLSYHNRFTFMTINFGIMLKFCVLVVI